MAEPERSPVHGLTRSGRGWYRRVAGVARYVCSGRHDAATADRLFEESFLELARPPIPRASVTLEQAGNAWLARQQQRVDAGALGRRTLGDYRDAVNQFCDVVGEDRQVANVGPVEFSRFAAAIERLSPHRRAKLIICVRAFVRWCAAPEVGLLSAVPVFGSDFRPPKRAEFRRARAASGQRLYAAAEVAALLAKASPDMKAMILLGLNGGMGNIDVATLEWPAVNLDGRQIVQPRRKTGVPRHIPLWVRTVEALQALSAAREGRVFVRGDGRAWLDDRGSCHQDLIAVEFSRLCEAAGVVNRGFYSLRRTFRTLADEVGDQRAAACIMGHELADMGSVYVQTISPQRLRMVVAHVHAALFGREDREPGGSSATPAARRKRKA
jgi:integrase